ncbi:DUF5956 family protein [Amycolatopsis nigrescens]|uniref:DUF5956 family protein n=1 Tax=Amycolatopsis nigrescens TaxID=381445 RepID=UPI000375D79A|nr:DUF5956 family protein [Amycolatopsis nigrescens]
MPENRWHDYPIGDIAGSRYAPLPDNGWGMLIAWAAGPARVQRVVDRLEDHTVRVIRRARRTSEATVTTEPRTEADQAGIEADVNSYLAEAAVPPRPRGYTWHLELPDGVEPRRLWAAVNARVEPGVPTPPHILVAATRALTDFGLHP